MKRFAWMIGAYLVIGHAGSGWTAEPWATVRRDPGVRRALAVLPRQAADAYFSGKTFMPPRSAWPIDGGLFVTLVRHAPDGHPITRACWGGLQPVGPDLGQAVCQTAVAVLHEDYRQKPVTATELADLRFVISLVGPLIPVGPGERLRPRTEGLYLTDGTHGGVLLPGEARTAAWQESTCRQKAGISPKATVYRYRFQTLVIEEPKR